MRRVMPWLLALMVGLSGGLSAQAPAKSAESSKTTWYFYTVKWGYQDEFLDLFGRNHYPLLKALEAAVATLAQGLLKGWDLRVQPQMHRILYGDQRGR